MSILDQLGIDKTFFIQIAIVTVTFLLLRVIYLKPFLKLFEARHQRTVADKEEAEKLSLQARLTLEEYKKKLIEEQKRAQARIEQSLQSAKLEEAKVINAARDEAKKIIVAAADQATKQRQELERALEFEIESIAKAVTDKLLARKGG